MPAEPLSIEQKIELFEKLEEMLSRQRAEEERIRQASSESFLEYMKGVGIIVAGLSIGGLPIIGFPILVAALVIGIDKIVGKSGAGLVNHLQEMDSAEIQKLKKQVLDAPSPEKDVDAKQQKQQQAAAVAPPQPGVVAPNGQPMVRAVANVPPPAPQLVPQPAPQYAGPPPLQGQPNVPPVRQVYPQQRMDAYAPAPIPQYMPPPQGLPQQQAYVPPPAPQQRWETLPPGYADMGRRPRADSVASYYDEDELRPPRVVPPPSDDVGTKMVPRGMPRRVMEPESFVPPPPSSPPRPYMPEGSRVVVNDGEAILPPGGPAPRPAGALRLDSSLKDVDALIDANAPFVLPVQTKLADGRESPVDGSVVFGDSLRADSFVAIPSVPLSPDDVAAQSMQGSIRLADVADRSVEVVPPPPSLLQEFKPPMADVLVGAGQIRQVDVAIDANFPNPLQASVDSLQATNTAQAARLAEQESLLERQARELSTLQDATGRVAALQQQVQQLTEAKELAEREKAALEVRTKAAESASLTARNDLEVVKGQVAEKLQQIAAENALQLQGQMEAISSELHAVGRTASAAQQDADGLRQRLAEAQRGIEERDAALRDEKDTNRVQAEANALAIVAVREEATRLAAESAASLASMQSGLDAARGEVDTLRRENADVVRRAVDESAMLLQQKAQRDAEIASLRDELSRLDISPDGITASITAMREKLQQALADKAVEADAAVTAAVADSRKEMMAEFDGRLAEVKREKEGVEEKLELAVAKVAEVGAEVAVLAADNLQMRSAHVDERRAQEAEVAQKMEQILEKEAAIVVLEQRVVDLTAQRDAQDRVIAERDAEIVRQAEALGNADVAANVAKAALEDKSRELQASAAEIEEKGRQLDAQAVQLEGQRVQIAGLEEKLAGAENRVEAATRELEALNVRVVELGDENVSLQQRLAAAVEASERKDNTHTEELAQQRAVMEAAEVRHADELKRVEAKAAAAEASHTAELKGRDGVIDRQQAALSAQVDALRRADGNIAARDATIDQKGREIDALNADILAARVEAGELQSRVETVTAELSGAREEISGLSANLADAQAAIERQGQEAKRVAEETAAREAKQKEEFERKMTQMKAEMEAEVLQRVAVARQQAEIEAAARIAGVEALANTKVAEANSMASNAESAALRQVDMTAQALNEARAVAQQNAELVQRLAESEQIRNALLEAAKLPSAENAKQQEELRRTKQAIEEEKQKVANEKARADEAEKRESAANRRALEAESGIVVAQGSARTAEVRIADITSESLAKQQAIEAERNALAEKLAMAERAQVEAAAEREMQASFSRMMEERLRMFEDAVGAQGSVMANALQKAAEDAKAEREAQQIREDAEKSALVKKIAEKDAEVLALQESTKKEIAVVTADSQRRVEEAAASAAVANERVGDVERSSALKIDEASRAVTEASEREAALSAKIAELEAQARDADAIRKQLEAEKQAAEMKAQIESLQNEYVEANIEADHSLAEFNAVKRKIEANLSVKECEELFDVRVGDALPPAIAAKLTEEQKAEFAEAAQANINAKERIVQVRAKVEGIVENFSPEEQERIDTEIQERLDRLKIKGDPAQVAMDSVRAVLTREHQEELARIGDAHASALEAKDAETLNARVMEEGARTEAAQLRGQLDAEKLVHEAQMAEQARRMVEEKDRDIAAVNDGNAIAVEAAVNVALAPLQAELVEAKGQVSKAEAEVAALKDAHVAEIERMSQAQAGAVEAKERQMAIERVKLAAEKAVLQEQLQAAQLEAQAKGLLAEKSKSTLEMFTEAARSTQENAVAVAMIAAASENAAKAEEVQKANDAKLAELQAKLQAKEEENARLVEGHKAEMQNLEQRHAEEKSVLQVGHQAEVDGLREEVSAARRGNDELRTVAEEMAREADALVATERAEKAELLKLLEKTNAIAQQAVGLQEGGERAALANRDDLASKDEIIRIQQEQIEAGAEAIASGLKREEKLEDLVRQQMARDSGVSDAAMAATAERDRMAQKLTASEARAGSLERQFAARSERLNELEGQVRDRDAQLLTAEQLQRRTAEGKERAEAQVSSLQQQLDAAREAPKVATESVGVGSDNLVEPMVPASKLEEMAKQLESLRAQNFSLEFENDDLRNDLAAAKVTKSVPDPVEDLAQVMLDRQGLADELERRDAELKRKDAELEALQERFAENDARLAEAARVVNEGFDEFAKPIRDELEQLKEQYGRLVTASLDLEERYEEQGREVAALRGENAELREANEEGETLNAELQAKLATVGNKKFQRDQVEAMDSGEFEDLFPDSHGIAPSFVPKPRSPTLQTDEEEIDLSYLDEMLARGNVQAEVAGASTPVRTRSPQSLVGDSANDLIDSLTIKGGEIKGAASSAEERESEVRKEMSAKYKQLGLPEPERRDLVPAFAKEEDYYKKENYKEGSLEYKSAEILEELGKLNGDATVNVQIGILKEELREFVDRKAVIEGVAKLEEQNKELSAKIDEKKAVEAKPKEEALDPEVQRLVEEMEVGGLYAIREIARNAVDKRSPSPAPSTVAASVDNDTGAVAQPEERKGILHVPEPLDPSPPSGYPPRAAQGGQVAVKESEKEGKRKGANSPLLVVPEVGGDSLVEELDAIMKGVGGKTLVGSNDRAMGANATVRKEEARMASVDPLL